MIKIMTDTIKSVLGGIIFFAIYSTRRALLTINNFLVAVIISALIALAGAVIFPFAFLALFVKAVYDPSFFQPGLMLLASLTYVCLSLSIYLVAATLFYAIADSAGSFFVGAKILREEGVGAFFAKVWNVICLRDLTQYSTVPTQSIQQMNQLLASVGVDERVVVHNFNSARLSDEDIALLVANRPINEDVLNNNERCQALIKLNKSESPLFFTTMPRFFAESDSNNPPVIFYKQYKKNDQWHAVPLSSRLYLKNEIEQCYNISCICPFTRDSFAEPLSHIEEGVEYETRYVWHPYYLETAPEGVCQELNELSQSLRNVQNQAEPTTSSARSSLRVYDRRLFSFNFGNTGCSLVSPVAQAGNEVYLLSPANP
jgi:hypothetical protein